MDPERQSARNDSGRQRPIVLTFHHPAVFHLDHPVAGRRNVCTMGDDHERQSLRTSNAFQEFEDFVLIDAIQVASRLIREKHLGTIRE